MNRADRAAQFAPFDALKGLKEAIKEREERKSRISRRELSDEQQEVLSETIAQLRKGVLIEVVFYSNGHYVKVQGEFTEINLNNKYIMVGARKINFFDLYEIKIL